jgi:hypothetical protein
MLGEPQQDLFFTHRIPTTTKKTFVFLVGGVKESSCESNDLPLEIKHWSLTFCEFARNFTSSKCTVELLLESFNKSISNANQFS